MTTYIRIYWENEVQTFTDPHCSTYPILEGDAYHDKIGDYIDGFIEGLKFCGHEFQVREINNEDMEYDKKSHIEFMRTKTHVEDEENE